MKQSEELTPLEADQLTKINNGAVLASRKIPYALQKRGMFRGLNTFAASFPFLSAASLIMLAFLFARDVMNITDFGAAPTKSVVTFWIMFFSSCLLIVFIEYKKISLKEDYFCDHFFDIGGAEKMLLIGFLSFSLISALGSSVGTYMTSLETTGFNLRKKQAAEIVSINTRYNTLVGNENRTIESLNKSIEITSNQIKALKEDKIRDGGKMVTRWTSGETAASLSPTLSREAAKIAELQAGITEMEKNRAAELKATNGDFSNSIPDIWGFSIDDSGMLIAIIAGILMLSLEIVNVYAHFYKWKYIHMCRVESDNRESIEREREEEKRRLAAVNKSANNPPNNSTLAQTNNIPVKNIPVDPVNMSANFNIAPDNTFKKYDTTKLRQGQQKIIDLARASFTEREKRNPTRKELSEETGFSIPKLRTYR